jgi:hypothetical protein
MNRRDFFKIALVPTGLLLPAKVTPAAKRKSVLEKSGFCCLCGGWASLRQPKWMHRHHEEFVICLLDDARNPTRCNSASYLKSIGLDVNTLEFHNAWQYGYGGE